MSPPRAKINSKDGVSQKAVDFVYIAKECGYHYVITAIVACFAWAAGAWLGPNAIKPTVNAVVTAMEEMAKTGTVLAQSNKAVIDRELQRQDERAESDARLEAVLKQLADGVKRLGDDFRNSNKGRDL